MMYLLTYWGGMSPWYPGDRSLSLTEAEALDSKALPGSALIDVSLEPAIIQ